MHDPEVLARFGIPTTPGERGIWVELHDKAAAMADRFNAELGTTDEDLFALAWTLFTAVAEQTLNGGGIRFYGGKLDGKPIDLRQIVEEFKRQREATGEIRT